MRRTNNDNNDNNAKQYRGLPRGRLVSFEPANNGHAIEP
jgi:hypothetical protein